MPNSLCSNIAHVHSQLSKAISGVGEHKLFLAMEQITYLIEVVLVGGRGLQTVRQATLGIDADMSLHAEIPLIAFLGLVHLAVTLSTLVFGGVGGFDDSGIGQRALLHHNTRVTELLVNGVEELADQLVLLQQMPEIHDGSAVRDGLVQGEFGKQTHRGHLVECVFLAPSLRLYHCCMQ